MSISTDEKDGRKADLNVIFGIPLFSISAYNDDDEKFFKRE